MFSFDVTFIYQCNHDMLVLEFSVQLFDLGLMLRIVRVRADFTGDSARGEKKREE
jgi:hypothetical protein